MIEQMLINLLVIVHKYDISGYVTGTPKRDSSYKSMVGYVSKTIYRNKANT